MKILLFGPTGQVGWELQRSLAFMGELVCVSSSDSALNGDFSVPHMLARTVALVRPDVIVNAAAYTAVDRAESEPELAHKINGESPAILASAAEAIGALLVHFSTDYVFDGEGMDCWVESAAPHPLNVYGASKLFGERAVQKLCRRHLIFRTSWVYGARGANFAKTMLRLAAEREELAVIADQIGAPTGADFLADLTAHAIRDTSADDHKLGLYHAVASGHASWHEYSQFLIESARDIGVQLKVKSVNPILSSEYPVAAQRPLNSRLSTAKITEVFGYSMPHWKVGVRRMVRELY